MSESKSCSESEPAEFIEATCNDHGPYRAKVFDFAALGVGKKLQSGCPTCLEERRARDEAREREAAAQELAFRIRRLHTESGVPSRFAQARLSTFVPAGDGQRKVHNIVSRYVDAFDPQAGIGMLLLGGCGTGKTLLATASANEVIDRGHAARYLRVTDAVRSIKATYARDSKVTELEAIACLVAPDLLVLDEIGVQFGTEHESVLLFEIIDRRYAECRSTILVSNLNATELEHYLGERIVDRFREMGAVLAFDWESHRGRRAA
jgi:DNA replication protein DnaC